MAGDLGYGHKYGNQILVKVPVDSSTAAISCGDILTLGTAGYYKKASAGDDVHGVSQQDLAAFTGSDGDYSILMDVSETSVYRYPVGTGTLTVAMRGKTCDIAGAQSIDVTASADDQVVIVECDTANNIALVTFKPLRAGVV